MFQESIKKSFECPITRLIIKRPVIAADGHTYDQGALEQWFENKKTSPLTGEPIASTKLFPNHHLKSQIEVFMDAEKKAIVQLIQEIKRKGDVVREYEESYMSDVDKLGKRASMKTKEVEELKLQLGVAQKQNEELVEKNKQLEIMSKAKWGGNIGPLLKYTIDDEIQGCALMHGPRRESNWNGFSLIPSDGEVWDEINPPYTCFDRSTSVKVSKIAGGRVYFQYLPHRGLVDSQPHDLLLEQFLQDYQPKITPQEFLEDLPELDGEDDSDFELE